MVSFVLVNYSSPSHFCNGHWSSVASSFRKTCHSCFVLFQTGSNLFRSLTYTPVIRALQVFTSATYSTNVLAQAKVEVQEFSNQWKDATEVLSKWGCSDDDLMRIFTRCPSLRNADPTQVQSKLCLSQLKGSFDQRIAHLMSLFESKEVLHKAIVRNPSLLLCDNRNDMKAIVVLYDELGVQKRDLIQMLLLRPTIISRTSFDDEKLEYINRSPHVLTLSTDKVQRNMTFILGTMKLEAKIILKYPYLLYANVDTVLKPRVLLATKILELDSNLQIKGPGIFRALRMSEERFLNTYVKCHDKETANELMEFYKRTKEVKRLAESSRKYISRGFPF
ncbi:Transcription termination factor, mitochondrial/chloroplastic [Sesbania bispinosa]|nr:Transcription termination factor, mitochondrial/chloroplastic [Sesbania bispinosa]